MTSKQVINQDQYKQLQQDISAIIAKTQEQIQSTANKILANSYWQIGKRISKENLTENANYQNLTLRDLENDLKINKDTLGNSLRLYKTYPEGLEEGLSWSHYRKLITISDATTRNDLTVKVKDQKWSVRDLETSIKELNNPKKSTSKTKTKIKRPVDPSYLYKAKIIDVVDGDTLILHIDLGFEVIKRQRVRLAQINAPEMQTKKGQESFRYLRDLCANIQEVAIKTNKVDIYGRFLGDIFYLPSDAKQGTTQGDIFEKGVYLNEKIVNDRMAEIF